MKTYSKYIGMAFAIAALAACSNEDEPTSAWQTDPDAVKINATVGNSLFTRSNPTNDDKQTEFNPNDKVAVIAAGQGTVTYTLTDGGWTPESGSYLTWKSNQMDISAYYPVTAGTSTTTFTMPTDQSELTKIADADYMVAEKTSYEKPEGHNNLELTLTRKMARVIVEIGSFNSQFATEAQKIVSDVRINSGAASVQTASSGTVTTVIPYAQGLNADKEGIANSTYTALVVPITTAKSGETFITLKDCAGNPLTVTGIPAMEAGNSYTYNLTVGKEALTIGEVTVEDWTTATITGGEIKAKPFNICQNDGDKNDYTGRFIQVGIAGNTKPLAEVEITGTTTSILIDDVEGKFVEGNTIWVCIPKVAKFFHTLTAEEVTTKTLNLPNKDGGSTLLKDNQYKAGDNYYKNDWIVALYMGINKYDGTVTKTPLYWATGNLIATKTNAANSGTTETAFHIATADETTKEGTKLDDYGYTPYNAIPVASGTDGYVGCNLGAQWNLFGWSDATGLKTSTNDSDYAPSITTDGGSISGNDAYDIARAQLGGSWYMPSNELIGITGSEYTDDNITNTLSFPAAGYRGGAKVCDRGYNGGYWSGLAANLVGAHYLCFDSGDVIWDNGSRYFGRSVRPVTE